ncbi:hypothetical protein G2W53_023250 [Senna tora]|uniref:Uncharacterized protein n=1 Tax=Senna tora TaxID=362788 RepID=A0A834TAP7_9FABA|nr:hypothetical protein G2W53_023250 [Senna tora]
MRILQADKPSGWIHKFSLRISYGSLNQMKVHGSIRIIFDWSWMYTSNCCDASILINMDMRIVSKNDFTSPNITMDKHTHKVSHSA